MNKDKYAPIVLFVYNRPYHLKKTINYLKKNTLAKKSKLIIFSDGPKAIKDADNVKKVRIYIRNIKGFNNVEIIERKKNFGLSKNIISGVSQVFKDYEKAIILEDDILVEKNFLTFMNEGLRLYAKKKLVASIHGYVYPLTLTDHKTRYFFIKGADCWGWATWKRAWFFFEKNGEKLKKIIDKKKLSREFNFNNSYDYYKMLNDQIKNKNNSWAIRWYASAFVNNMMTMYPSKSFVKNIGIDGTGTHGKSNKIVNLNKFISKNYLSIKSQKVKIEENIIMRKKFENYFRKNSENFIVRTLKKYF
mgnify:FL=1|tara:strand:+ start:1009 stop:1920 length:912 start_codon:yes stop_codon:yes gene_type:complete